MQDAPKLVSGFSRHRPPVVVSRGPDQLPLEVFEACPIPIIWAAYWYVAVSSTGADDVMPSVNGVCVCEYWGGVYGIFKLRTRPGGPSIAWDRQSYRADHDALWFDTCRGSPLGTQSPDGVTRGRPEWASVWAAVEEAEAICAAQQDEERGCARQQESTGARERQR